MRKIHFPGGEVWQYKVGKSFVTIRNPNNKKSDCTINYLIETIMGKTLGDEILPDHYKKDEDVLSHPTPGDIKEYVEMKLR